MGWRGSLSSVGETQGLLKSSRRKLKNSTRMESPIELCAMKGERVVVIGPK